MPFKPARACSLAALTACLLAPATAHAGFFEQLFGMAPQADPYQAGPSYAPVRPNYGARPVHRAPKKHVVVESKPAKPGKAKSNDLMHDASLRAGDAVMMKDGVHVFEGDRGSDHEKGDFVALDASREVNKKERAALAALDPVRADPLRSGVQQPDTLASGRSAAVAAPVNAGYPITDARGKSVRYVGP